MSRVIKFRARWKYTWKAIPDFMNEYGLDALNDGRFVVEQFTGLTDCLGKEIYEGDIIKHAFADNNCVVQYIAGAFEAKDDKVDECYSMAVSRVLLEVIGNIHQNHELLGEQK